MFQCQGPEGLAPALGEPDESTHIYCRYRNMLQIFYQVWNTDTINDSHLDCEYFISGVTNQKMKGFIPSRRRGALTNLGKEPTLWLLSNNSFFFLHTQAHYESHIPTLVLCETPLKIISAEAFGSFPLFFNWNVIQRIIQWKNCHQQHLLKLTNITLPVTYDINEHFICSVLYWQTTAAVQCH